MSAAGGERILTKRMTWKQFKDRGASFSSAVSWNYNCSKCVRDIKQEGIADGRRPEKGLRERTGQCCWFGVVSIGAQVDSASAPWQAFAWCGKICGSGEDVICQPPAHTSDFLRPSWRALGLGQAPAESVQEEAEKNGGMQRQKVQNIGGE